MKKFIRKLFKNKKNTEKQEFFENEDNNKTNPIAMKNDFFQINHNSETQTCEVFLEKEATLKCDLPGLKQAIGEAMGQFRKIVIKSKAPVKTDIAFIQVLKAIKSKANKENIRVDINLELEETSKALTEKSDLFKIIKN
jgi:hypothetical protein